MITICGTSVKIGCFLLALMFVVFMICFSVSKYLNMYLSLGACRT